MQELDLINVNKKMREVYNQDTVWQHIITPKVNILNFSNNMHAKCIANENPDSPDRFRKVN